MWVRESSISPKWIGHNERAGYLIIRGVPVGNPKIIQPRPIESANFVDVHKMFEAMDDAQRKEWNDLKEKSEGVTASDAFEVVGAPANFDWAAPLLKVQTPPAFRVAVVNFSWLRIFRHPGFVVYRLLLRPPLPPRWRNKLPVCSTWPTIQRQRATMSLSANFSLCGHLEMRITTSGCAELSESRMKHFGYTGSSKLTRSSSPWTKPARMPMGRWKRT